MTLEQVRTHFGTELGALYADQEWQTFFYWLLEERLGLDRLGFSTNRSLAVSDSDLAYLNSAIERLKQYEPIQYIIGYTEFCGLRIGVNSSTLIPRPETEELVNWVVHDRVGQEVEIVDLGTGSGCIALSLAKQIPMAKVSGMDLSDGALLQAQRNAKELGLEVSFFQSDMLNDNLSQSYEVLVSNPPYVREQEKALMQQNVLVHEPDSALFVPDDDPLLYYRRLAELAAAHLKPNGAVYVEINEYLGEATKKLFQADGFARVELRQDLFGKDRMIKAIKTA